MTHQNKPLIERLQEEARAKFDQDFFNFIKSVDPQISEKIKLFGDSVIVDTVQQVEKAERERINEFFANKADYDTDSDCIIITEKIYHQAFGCKSVNQCTDCAQLPEKK